MIVALAGRRIDARDAESPRFPLSSVDIVRARLLKLLSEKGAMALVCSAACGADLIALSVAGELGIRRRVVLPFPREQFRETSVVDRPGDWGALFDAICDEVENGDLIILGCSKDDETAYSIASRAILDEAANLQTLKSGKGDHSILTVIVWEGSARGADDETAAFASEAASRGFVVEEILTG